MMELSKLTTSNAVAILQKLKEFSRTTHSNKNITLATKLSNKFFLIEVSFFVVALAIAGILKLAFTPDEPSRVKFYLALAGFSCISLTYILYIAMLIANLINDWGSFKNPYKAIISNAETTAQQEVELLDYLKWQDESELKYALAHLDSERQELESRTAAITGSIAKVGIIPSILSLLIMLPKINELPKTNTSIDAFIAVLPYAGMVFLLMAFVFDRVIGRMNRHIDLIKIAIEHSKNAKAKALVNSAL